jgi:uric acid transporter
VGFGMIPLVSPNFFKALPHELHPLLESGILLCAIVAVVLNVFFNGVKQASTEEIVAAAKQAEAH